MAVRFPMALRCPEDRRQVPGVGHGQVSIGVGEDAGGQKRLDHRSAKSASECIGT
jgi:hypothetical protein